MMESVFSQGSKSWPWGCCWGCGQSYDVGSVIRGSSSLDYHWSRGRPSLWAEVALTGCKAPWVDYQGKFSVVKQSELVNSLVARSGREGMMSLACCRLACAGADP